MTHFIAQLFYLLFIWQKKYFGNEMRAAFYASAATGILFGMNLMLICYKISFLFFEVVISFLRAYYIFSAIAIVLAILILLLHKKRFEILLTMVTKTREAS